MNDVLDVAVRVGAALEAIGADYFVGGSVASSFQGQPRATNDIDIVIRMTPAQVPALASALGSDFDVDQEALIDALRRRRSWNIFYLPLMIRIDLFALGSSEFDQLEFERRQRIQIGGAILSIKTAEDSVLRKLRWFREGGETSTQQWRDVVEVLRVSRGVDRGYLETWAVKLGVDDLLERATTEASG